MEKERERNIGRLPLTRTWLATDPTAQACALTGNQTGHLSVCRMMSNQLSHTGWGFNKMFLFFVLYFICRLQLVLPSMWVSGGECYLKGPHPMCWRPRSPSATWETNARVPRKSCIPRISGPGPRAVDPAGITEFQCWPRQDPPRSPRARQPDGTFWDSEGILGPHCPTG